MFFVTRGDAVLGYAQRFGVSSCGPTPLYAFPRLVLAPEVCIAHVNGDGLLQLFKDAEIVDRESVARYAVNHILLGAFELPTTGRPDLSGVVFCGFSTGPDTPTLRTMLRAAREALGGFGDGA